MNITLRLGFPMVPTGSAAKWARECRAAKIYFGVDGNEQIIAASGRLLKWYSGNWSSRAKPVIAHFEELREKLELELARDGVAAFAAQHVETRRCNGRRITDAICSSR